jgi:hypothetical protein
MYLRDLGHDWRRDLRSGVCPYASLREDRCLGGPLGHKRSYLIVDLLFRGIIFLE